MTLAARLCLPPHTFPERFRLHCCLTALEYKNISEFLIYDEALSAHAGVSRMHNDFSRPSLTITQKQKLKELCERDNYHGFIALGSDIVWIGLSISACVWWSCYFIPLSVLFIGARQRALASLLHDAAHGTLFASKMLNETIGRVVCGWTILQSLSAYRASHVSTTILKSEKKRQIPISPIC